MSLCGCSINTLVNWDLTRNYLCSLRKIDSFPTNWTRVGRQRIFRSASSAYFSMWWSISTLRSNNDSIVVSVL